MSGRKRSPSKSATHRARKASAPIGPDEWHLMVKAIGPHVVKISTPRGHGTGFLVAHAPKAGLVGLATANHVVDHEDWWGEPLRVHHPASGESVFLGTSDRVIYRNSKNDTAVLIMGASQLKLPQKPMDLIPETFHVMTGVEVGWIGFPGIAPEDMCFFSGRIIDPRLSNATHWHVKGGGPSAGCNSTAWRASGATC